MFRARDERLFDERMSLQREALAWRDHGAGS
jgi:hypothetical protein